ncbi:MAG: hypothetical protein J6N76_03675 [Lachnospiraceae bacterium]|nr:hypothetical protein [Lachnospiraceae bacterium]
MTEVLEHGRNEHFKNATDFMRYFESLYPASPSLLKQVQRAVREMDMPKDSRGYYIINKTRSQLQQDDELSAMLKKTNAKITDTENLDFLFLATEPAYKSYLLQLITESDTLRDKYITALDTTNGIIFITKTKQALSSILERLSIVDEESDS